MSITKPAPTDIDYGMGSRPLHYARAKLTAAQRDEIACRRMDGESTVVLAVEYGVSGSTIRNIVPRDRT